MKKKEQISKQEPQKKQRPNNAQINQKTLEYKNDQIPKPQNQGENLSLQQGSQMKAERKILKVKGEQQENLEKESLKNKKEQEQEVFLKKQQKIQQSEIKLVKSEPIATNIQVKEGQQNQQTISNLQQFKKKNQQQSLQQLPQNQKQSQQDSQKKPEKQESIFQRNNQSLNLFKNKIQEKQKNNQRSQKPEPNFSTTFRSLISPSSVPPPSFLTQLNQQQNIKEKEENSQQAEKDSEQFIKQQQLIFNPQKSTGNYKYQTLDSCQKIFSEKAIKIKKMNNQIIQNVDIIVATDLKTKLTWLSILLSSTKIQIFKGFLVKGKTQIKHFENRDQNVVLSLIINKTKSSESSRSQVLKIQFEKDEIGKIFLSLVKSMFLN